MDPKNNQYVNVSDTHDDEQLVDNFMRQFANVEIADNGFSQQVMRELPATRNIVRLNAIWTAVCATAGVVLFFLFDGLSLLKALLLNLFGNIVGTVANIVTTGNYTTPLMVMAGLVIVCIVALVPREIAIAKTAHNVSTAKLRAEFPPVFPFLRSSCTPSASRKSFSTFIISFLAFHFL